MPDAPDPAADLDAAINKLPHLRDLDRLTQLRLVETLALRADTPDTVIAALSSQIQLANRLDRLEDQIAALQRMHTLYTTNPRYQFARGKVILYHKWIVEPLVERADIPLALINSMFDRLDAVFRAEHVGTRATDLLRCRTAWMMGRTDDARRFYDAWRAAPAGKSDDCDACILNAQIEFLIADNRLDEAFDLAKPLFQGRLHCAEVPAITYSRLLFPAIKRDQPQLAFGMHRATLRTVRKKPDLLAALARHIFFLAITGNATAARRLAAVALARAPKALDYSRLGAYAACAMWFAILAVEGVPSIKLPRTFPLADDQGNVPTPEAAAFCLQEARHLATRFDARNGTSLYTDALHTTEEAIRNLSTPPT